MRTKRGITREVYRPCRCRNPIATPESTVPIRQTTRGEMACRQTCNFAGRLPPIQLWLGRDSVPGEHAGNTERDDKARRVLGRDTPKSGQIKVVVVIVAKQDEMDSWEVFETNTRRSHSRWAKPGQWTWPIAPDWVR